MSFKNIKPGDRVTFRQSRNGATTLVGAKVNPLLIFDTHVVVNVGNNGTVVNDNNFIGVTPAKRPA